MLTAWALALQPAYGGGAKDVAPVKSEEGWSMTFVQTNYHVCKGVATKTVACFDNGIFKFILAPPDYKNFTVLNQTNKTYMVYDTAQWFAQMCGSLPLPISRLVFKRVETVRGFKCKYYEGFLGDGSLGAKYWITDTIPISQKLCSASNQICGAQRAIDKLGVLIRMLARTRHSSMVVNNKFEMQEMTPIKVPLRAFEIPKDYTKAKDGYTLFLSSDGKLKESDIEDLFEHHFKN